MKPTTIHLGFEVPSGDPVAIPIAHMCVTGQTQAAGKTTTLEALVDRSGLKAIAFVTKRGEGAFKFNHEEFRHKNVLIDPYFRHRADWQFVSDILGAILSEKLKFQRPWIMQVCRGAKTLDDVRANVVARLYGNKQKKIKAATGLANSVYTELEEYLNLLMPELARLPYTDKLELETGLNVMDLSAYSTPLQMLVVSSVLEWIYKHETDVITVIPEAWEFVPAGRNSPAKSAAIALIRKGGALRNFIWLDSQDLASVDTEIRRACGVWILGVQREQNEVKRVLTHIPAGTKRPKLEDIMHLERGQFFVCHGREIRKVYVQPKWLGPVKAYEAATGHAWEGRDSDLDELYAGLPEIEFPATHGQLTGVGDNWGIGVVAKDGPPFGDVGPFYELPKSLEKTVVKGASAKLLEDDFQKDLNLLSSGDTIIEPDNAPKREDYQMIPAGLPYEIDDGIQVIRHSKVKETDEMTNEEHDRKVMDLTHGYEMQIKNLKRAMYHVLARLPGSYAARHSFEQWLANYPASLDPTLEEDEAVTVHKPDDSPRIETAISHSAVAHEIMNNAVFIDNIVREVAGRIPTNGMVKVEPREVVLKEFQAAEVERILQTAENRSVWQKQVIRFIEAQGKPFQKAALITNILGRKTVNMQRDFKDQYEEIDELCALGFLRKDPKNGVYPNMGVGIKRRLEAYSPSDTEIDNIIGQVMLKLK